jgi:hypothetical protein
MCQSGGVDSPLREASVSEATTIGLDIAKHVSHAHGADEHGAQVFTRRSSTRRAPGWLLGRCGWIAPKLHPTTRTAPCLNPPDPCPRESGKTPPLTMLIGLGSQGSFKKDMSWRLVVTHNVRGIHTLISMLALAFSDILRTNDKFYLK